MGAQESLRSGRVDEALAELQRDVRRQPADARLRIFLFQLLCVRGEWSRALTQLNVAGELDAGAMLMVETYREALRCEVFRGQVFAGKRVPLALGEPDPWFASLLSSLSVAAEGRREEAAALRTRALDEAPASSGMLNGRPFEWIADGDSRLGPCLEVIIGGRYYWVPFHRIASLESEAPGDLRDFVWTPAQLRWTNGGDAVALIPTRYPGSESGEPEIQLARRTEWREEADGGYAGLGQRVWITDEGETALLDVRSIVLDPADVPQREAAP